MADIKTSIDLGSTFQLIQEIKKGIKQKCNVEIFDENKDIFNRGLCIRITTKNYKTKDFMYFERVITEKELIESPENTYYGVIKHIIDTANDLFRKGQSRQSNADYCPCCDSHNCTCNAC